MPRFFLSMDGVDGAGKSTQIKLLEKWFTERGETVCTVRDPGGTHLGESVREILLHRTEIPLSPTAEMLLYMASRAQLVSEVIGPALEAGQVVISDRYLLANVVYQSATGGVEPDAIWSVGATATGGLIPDLTIVLDLDASISMQRIRGKPDRLESRGLDYMAKVRQGFLEQSRRLGDQGIVVDASQSIESVHGEITRAVSQKRPS